MLSAARLAARRQRRDGRAAGRAARRRRGPRRRPPRRTVRQRPGCRPWRAARERRPATRRGRGAGACGGAAAQTARPPAPRRGDHRAARGKAGANGRAGAELRAAADQAVGDAGPKMPRPSRAERGQDDRHAHRRWSGWRRRSRLVNWENSVEPMPMMTASTSTLMPEEMTLPSTRLGHEGGLAEQAERDQDEARERRQLELDQGDEELDRQDEEAPAGPAPRREAGTRSG